MARADQATSPATKATGDDYNLMHSVDGFQHLLDRLHLKTPRALCGELLVQNPDRADPLATNAPVCPRCEAKEKKR
jgi:hypothetical protein